jgi:hypothetical protein
MRFLRITDQAVINLDLVTDVQWRASKERPDATVRWLEITFAAPNPASVGSSDWATGCRMVKLPDTKETHTVWQHILMFSDDPAIPI